MTQFRINNMEAWAAQNRAEAMDCVEGCLLDNVWYSCKGGEAFVFEEYLNANSSGYMCYFFRTKEVGSPAYNAVLARWYSMVDEVEETA